MTAARHPRDAAAAGPPCLTWAVMATAAYVRALADYYALLGRPLPDLQADPAGGEYA
ncbi:hypothetical protein GFY24_00905 [Nocardia sp. SYP-A9097]|uniref:hypothetical protein n=1 Tax=Nocardia sp. SYP-A9097 TaxID=2663237 RepID=UPI00129B49C1|nr:hypothetical protein [Nocardia sp. SYP-A9097]MRH86036.1 hypothetical protein [Nocardia sp. SYP-A9097]